MKKLMTIAFALTIAAALALTTTSCSNEDNLTETPSQPQPQKVHITVGAGIGNNATTRSAVDYNTSNKQRTLKFTEGDRLYVRAVIQSEDDPYGNSQEIKIMAGYLSIASIGANGTSATFTGDLDVFEGGYVTEYNSQWVITGGHYEMQDVEVGYDEYGPIYEQQDVWVEDGVWETDYTQPVAYSIYNSSSYAFNDPNNPLDECEYVNAVLVHKDAGTHFSVDDDTKYWDYTGQVATDVTTLMTTFLVVQGRYDSQSQSFDLYSNGYQPILNCTISGLTAGATYNVTYLYGSSSYYGVTCDLSSFTADAQGKITFAFIGCAGDYYHALRFVNAADEYEWKLVELGQKELEDKVYNVTKTAVDDPSTPVRPVKPTLSRSDGFDANELILGDPGDYRISGTCLDPDTNDYGEDVNLTISGNSKGYYFFIWDGGTVTLTGNGTASYIVSNCDYIYAYKKLTIMLNSNYTIITDCETAIYASDLTLGVTNGTKTLTVTVNDDTYKGLNASNYYVYDHSDDITGEEFYRLENPSVLAAPGCTVTLTSETDNQDGTYTYVYTVTKN